MFQPLQSTAPAATDPLFTFVPPKKSGNGFFSNFVNPVGNNNSGNANDNDDDGDGDEPKIVTPAVQQQVIDRKSLNNNLMQFFENLAQMRATAPSKDISQKIENISQGIRKSIDDSNKTENEINNVITHYSSEIAKIALEAMQLSKQQQPNGEQNLKIEKPIVLANGNTLIRVKDPNLTSQPPAAANANIPNIPNRMNNMEMYCDELIKFEKRLSSQDTLIEELRATVESEDNRGISRSDMDELRNQLERVLLENNAAIEKYLKEFLSKLHLKVRKRKYPLGFNPAKVGNDETETHTIEKLVEDDGTEMNKEGGEVLFPNLAFGLKETGKKGKDKHSFSGNLDISPKARTVIYPKPKVQFVNKLTQNSPDTAMFKQHRVPNFPSMMPIINTPKQNYTNGFYGNGDGSRSNDPKLPSYEPTSGFEKAASSINTPPSVANNVQTPFQNRPFAADKQKTQQTPEQQKQEQINEAIYEMMRKVYALVPGTGEAVHGTTIGPMQTVHDKETGETKTQQRTTFDFRAAAYPSGPPVQQNVRVEFHGNQGDVTLQNEDDDGKKECMSICDDRKESANKKCVNICGKEAIQTARKLMNNYDAKLFRGTDAFFQQPPTTTNPTRTNIARNQQQQQRANFFKQGTFGGQPTEIRSGGDKSHIFRQTSSPPPTSSTYPPSMNHSSQTGTNLKKPGSNGRRRMNSKKTGFGTTQGFTVSSNFFDSL